MSTITTDHPLIDGYPPLWASSWGQDRYGPWIAIEVKDVEQRLRWIPPGRFAMESPKGEAGSNDDSDSLRTVSIDQGFWMFATPCTQAFWVALMGGANPSYFQSARRPVEQVSWKMQIILPSHFRI